MSTHKKLIDSSLKSKNKPLPVIPVILPPEMAIGQTKDAIFANIRHFKNLPKYAKSSEDLFDYFCPSAYNDDKTESAKKKAKIAMYQTMSHFENLPSCAESVDINCE